MITRTQHERVKWGQIGYDHQQKSRPNVSKNRITITVSESCFTNAQLYLKVVVYDTPIQGRQKINEGIRTNDTEGITTQNIVLKEIFNKN